MYTFILMSASSVGVWGPHVSISFSSYSYIRQYNYVTLLLNFNFTTFLEGPISTVSNKIEIRPETKE